MSADKHPMISHELASTEEIAEPRRRQRAWRLVAWLALVSAALASYWQLGSWRDYKNSAVVGALAAALLGISVWIFRNAGGSSRRRLLLAVLVWAPLWVISPWGLVVLVNNGNVGIVGWRWRWEPQPDEVLANVRAEAVQIEWKTTPADYPAFLGGAYWAEVKNVDLDPDWTTRQPKLLWRQPIGAGWSGFAIVDKYAITQEQRGPTELVVCYELKTGSVAWSHEDDVRWDPSGSGALGGVGPRATPTIHNGRVYTQGATGIVNCIDGATGRLVWTHDTLVEEGARNVMWGKAGSPIVVDDWIVVSVGGNHENSLVAYDQKTGRKAWGGGDRQSSYATPVLTELHGVRQIVVVNQDFVTAHRATDGVVLWEHEFEGNSDSNASASQPVPIGDNRLLLTKGYSVQAEVIDVQLSDGGKWAVERVWQKPVLRTKLSNVVIRDGYAYAISDVDLECVDLKTGRRKWKSRRRPEIGNGQIMLVGNSILALSEAGEVVLVEATPQAFRESASFSAISGLTWNNPALSGRYLLVRNGQEAACFELPLRGDDISGHESSAALGLPSATGG